MAGWLSVKGWSTIWWDRGLVYFVWMGFGVVYMVVVLGDIYLSTGIGFTMLF